MLADLLTPPFRLRCRCGAVHEATVERGVSTDLGGVKERWQYRVRLDLLQADQDADTK